MQPRLHKVPVLHTLNVMVLVPPALQFVFWTTCGDRYYLGLDALALYDVAGNRIPIRPSQIFGIPSSVNDLSGRSEDGEGDVRVVANLSREYSPSSWANSDSWLAPLAHSLSPGAPNLLYIVFHQPVCISMIKVSGTFFAL